LDFAELKVRYLNIVDHHL